MISASAIRFKFLNYKIWKIMKEMHRISIFSNLKTVLSEKVFCVRLTDFSLSGFIFTLVNFFQFQKIFKIYSGKPAISFKFNSDKNKILKRENLQKQKYI